jgi:uncharacterized protein
MKPRVTLITLGVDDLEKSLAFYRDGLGLATPGIVGREYAYGAVAFFDLQPGLKLAIWNRASIAHDTDMAEAAPSPTEFTEMEPKSSVLHGGDEWPRWFDERLFSRL